MIGPVAVGANHHSPRASGTLDAHYAPRTPMRLLPRTSLLAHWHAAQSAGQAVALLMLETLPEGGEGVGRPSRATRYGHDLYAALRRLDAVGAALLLVEQPPTGDDWLAVNDRLRRAAVGAVLELEDDAT